MSWFERHLNWSLVFGLIGLSIVVGIVERLAALVPVLGNLLSLGGSIIPLIVELLLLIFGLIVTWWYLGKKERSKWYMLLLIVPIVISIIAVIRSVEMIGDVFSFIENGKLTPNMIIGFSVYGLLFISAVGGFIWLLCLKNKAIIYGGDFADESSTSRQPDTGQFSGPDDREQKELDYSPAKNVMDIVDGGNVKDVKDIKEIEDVSAASVAGEEAPLPEKVVQRSVSTERLKMPILLDNAGAAIRCFYHPGADAVNLCSRCKQYVCNECNYVTGTHPICRNCWEKRTETPLIAVPSGKPEGPASGKPEKQKSVETGKPEKQKIAAPGKAEKPEAKKNEWLGEFMALYEQASPIINVVIRKSADGMPASPLDLMEGLKLRPMLELAKKLSKPKEKELREAKNEFEQVLSSCIKIADAAADFVSGGGQALLGGPDFARIVDGIETANGLMGKLSQRLTVFSQSQV